MKTEQLSDRINRVINTNAFESTLARHGQDLMDFQLNWHKESKGAFNRLPDAYREAILAGEQELRVAKAMKAIGASTERFWALMKLREP